MAPKADGLKYSLSDSKRISYEDLPNFPTCFLYRGGSHDAWLESSGDKRRFILLNVHSVIELYGIKHAKLKELLSGVDARIRENTKWFEQYQFSYKAKPEGLSKKAPKTGRASRIREEPKSFGEQIAYIFVIYEFAMLNKLPLDHFRKLRILPAQYIIEDFDEDRLELLRTYYKELEVDERKALMSKKPAATFDKAILVTAKQPFDKENGSLLDDMAIGNECVTMRVAYRVREAINKIAPVNLKVGRVSCAGLRGNHQLAGTGAAASNMQDNVTRDEKRLGELAIDQEPQEPNFDSDDADTIVKKLQSISDAGFAISQLASEDESIEQAVRRPKSTKD